MKFAQKMAMMAIISVTFLGAPLASAFGETHAMREPAATKKKKKAKKAKKKKKTNKQKAKKAAVRPKREAVSKSHAPKVQHGAVSDPYTEMSNEKKDDLPPPQNTEPTED